MTLREKAVPIALTLAAGALVAPVSGGSAAASVDRAEPAAAPRIIAGPQGGLTGYLTPAVVVSKQTGVVLYTNVDVVRHDVVQDPRSDGVAGSTSNPWCKRFRGSCPLFWAPLLGLGESAQVQGLQATVTGRSYTFYCSLHPGMRGTLAVVA